MNYEIHYPELRLNNIINRQVKMTTIKFTDDEKADLTSKIQGYFSRELEQDIGQFDAEFLLDFFSDEIGGHYYNRGLSDAQIVISGKLENIADIVNETISEMEKPVN
jgi:uncharacterized protein (DUF2164 family)